MSSESQASKGVWSFHNTNQARSKQLSHFHNTCNYISLCHYIWRVEYIKLLYISVFTSWKRDTRSGNLSCHRLQTFDIRTKTCSLEEIFRGRSSFLPSVINPEQAAICLDSNSYAFKAASSTSLSAAIPKKPSRSEAVTSDQTNSDKTL